MRNPLIEPLPAPSWAATDGSTLDLDPAASNGTGLEPDGESPPGTPRWVKAFGIIAIVLLLAIAGMHLTGNAPMQSLHSGGIQHGMQAP